ncbi:transposase [Streptomyces sp. NPDC005989]|uniref:transposase n=1 Tax=Streptomyces sp. NPDC005989 TaxID=3156727 RepID=UPI003402C9BC
MQLAKEEWEFIGLYRQIGEYGPYSERLRQQFEGVIWRFKTGGQWREMPREFDAWSAVSNRFRLRRNAGVLKALLEGLIAEAAKRGEVDLSLVSIDSTTARAHHDAAGMHLGEDVLTAPEKAAAEEKEVTSKGATWKNKTDTTSKWIPNGRSDDAFGPDESSDSGPPLLGHSRGLGRYRTDLVNH